MSDPDRGQYFINPAALFIIEFPLSFLFTCIFIPVAAVTNYHKLSGLNQHKFIILQFWKPEVQNRSNWVKIKMLAKLISFWRL